MMSVCLKLPYGSLELLIQWQLGKFHLKIKQYGLLAKNVFFSVTLYVYLKMHFFSRRLVYAAVYLFV